MSSSEVSVEGEQIIKNWRLVGRGALCMQIIKADQIDGHGDQESRQCLARGKQEQISSDGTIGMEFEGAQS